MDAAVTYHSPIKTLPQHRVFRLPVCSSTLESSFAGRCNKAKQSFATGRLCVATNSAGSRALKAKRLAASTISIRQALRIASLVYERPSKRSILVTDFRHGDFVDEHVVAFFDV